MANLDVGMYEANNPLILYENAVDVEIPDDNCVEYSLIPALPAGGDQPPSWWIELSIFVHVEDPGADFSTMGVILAPSTGGPDGATVPQPVLDIATMRTLVSDFSPANFLWGSGPGSAYEINMGSTTITPNPATPYSLYFTRFPLAGDTATYSLRTIVCNRKDIS